MAFGDNKLGYRFAGLAMIGLSLWFAIMALGDFRNGDTGRCICDAILTLLILAIGVVLFEVMGHAFIIGYWIIEPITEYLKQRRGGSKDT